MDEVEWNSEMSPTVGMDTQGDGLRHAFLELLEGGRDRVSSAWPVRVAFCLASVAVLALVCAWLNFQMGRGLGRRDMHVQSHSLAMAGIGVIDGLAALVVGTLWKSVRVGANGFTVSDLFRSEEVLFEDVCLVVPGTGVFGDVMRLHFRRPTRFGWGVVYVPRDA